MGTRTTRWVVSVVGILAFLAPFALGEAAADRGVKGISSGGALAAPPLGSKGTSWAILIGVGKYDEHPAIANLKYTLPDVKGLYDVLTGEGGFPKENVYLMCDDVDDPKEQPRQNRIFARLNATLRLPKKEDVILVYFAGHGIEADGKTYLLPSDATMTQLKTSSIPLSFLRERLEACAAEKKFLILDACHSGQGRNANRLSAAMAREIEGMENAKGIVTLSACTLDQQSFEWEEMGHGVFTYFLMRGLRGAADRDGNKIVGALELSNYVSERVSRWAADRQMIQTPMFVGEITGDIALMRGVGGLVGEGDGRPGGKGGGTEAGGSGIVWGSIVLVAVLVAAVVMLLRRRPERASAIPAAKLVVPSLVGPGRKVFVFAKPSLTFGRDSVDRCANDVALRLLPTGKAGDANFDNTAKIPRVAGMFELRRDGAYLRRLSDKTLAVDGQPLADTEQKLHSNSVVSVAGVLELQVKAFRVGAADGPVGALRISRIDNAENHEYVLMREAISIGADESGVVVIGNGPKRVGKLAFADGSFWLSCKPDSGVCVDAKPVAGKRVPLAHGHAIDAQGCKILFETVAPDDFKEL